jgi:hypothetical protein
MRFFIPPRVGEGPRERSDRGQEVVLANTLGLKGETPPMTLTD